MQLGHALNLYSSDNLAPGEVEGVCLDDDSEEEEVDVFDRKSILLANTTDELQTALMQEFLNELKYELGQD